MQRLRCLRPPCLVRVGLAIAVLGSLLISPPSGLAAAETVSVCGQLVETRGVLAGDLDCSAEATYLPAVKVGGTLDLAGFTITGPPEVAVISCVGKGGTGLGSCRVRGPGRLIGGTGQGFELGIEGTSVKLIDVDVENVFFGAFAERVLFDGTNLIAPRRGGIIATRKAKLTDSVILDSGGVGVQARRGIKLTGSSVMGSAFEGLVTPRHIVLKDSVVTGNALDVEGCQTLILSPGCGGSLLCADVVTTNRLKVRGTSTCDTSLVQDGSCAPGSVRDLRSGATFGVCTND